MLTSAFRIPFFYLLVTVLLGFVLRLMGYVSLPFNFKNILHAHSHIAFLGWVYSSFFVLYIELFSSKKEKLLRSYRTQFIITQVINIGLLVSFLLQGYGPFSIFFSVMHIIMSYVFVYTISKDIKSNYAVSKSVVRLVYMAFSFLIISSLAPFFLPVAIKIFGKYSPEYFNAIYSYLHFQYNGWFMFSIIAILYRFMEIRKVKFDGFVLKKLANLLFLSVILTLFLSFLWVDPPLYFYFLAGVGGLLQLFVFPLLFQNCVDVLRSFNGMKYSSFKWILYTIAISLSLKLLFQFLASIPVIADHLFQVREFIIAYLHLFLIGVVSFFILFFSIETGKFRLSELFQKGCFLFVCSYFLSELILFLQGSIHLFSFSPVYVLQTALLVLSFFFLIAVVIILSNIK